MPLSIGLVYDLKEDYLRAGLSPEQVMEFDSEETITGIAEGLASLGHGVDRVGRGVELARRLASGERWDLVFNIAEGVAGRSREAQVPAVCELFDQAYTFADPLTCALTLDKAMAKRVVRDLGLPTAPFGLVRRVEDVAALEPGYPVFAKPVAEGSSKGVTASSLARTAGELAAVCRELLSSFSQPVLVERYLPGRELTVGVVGNGAKVRAIGVMEVLITSGEETHAYTALNKDEYLERVTYRLVENEPLFERARAVALAAYLGLGCRDGARVDLRCDEHGEPNFLEANPLPGLHHVRSDLPIMARLAGHDFRTLLSWIVDAAVERNFPYRRTSV
ncbi:MAG: D-alanine--D-alanine ligase [Acidobacteriota bacterium]